MRLTTDQFGHRRPGAFVRNRHEVDVRHRLQQSTRQMRRGACTRRGEIERARFCFGQRNQTGHRIYTQRRMGDKHIGNIGHCSDRYEIGQRVIRQFLKQRRIDAEICIRQQQCVTVTGGIGHQTGTDHGVAAGTVVDHHLLSGRLGQIGRNKPADDVGAAARAERNDQAQRAVRIMGGLRNSGGGQSGCRGQQD